MYMHTESPPLALGSHVVDESLLVLLQSLHSFENITDEGDEGRDRGKKLGGPADKLVLCHLLGYSNLVGRDGERYREE